MRTCWKELALLLLVPVCAPSRDEPKQAVSNPAAGDATAILEGQSLFRADCSPCHGPQARGGARGPDLTSGRWVHGGSDAGIFHTITQGVPGTEMPGNAFEDSEVWSLIAFLRSLNPS